MFGKTWDKLTNAGESIIDKASDMFNNAFNYSDDESHNNNNAEPSKTSENHPHSESPLSSDEKSVTHNSGKVNKCWRVFKKKEKIFKNKVYEKKSISKKSRYKRAI